MKGKGKESMGLSQSEYDFSQECPEFRERLFAEFMKRADEKEVMGLSDEELDLLNAAGDGRTVRSF